MHEPNPLLVIALPQKTWALIIGALQVLGEKSPANEYGQLAETLERKAIAAIEKKLAP